jgi:hypothetical protein
VWGKLKDRREGHRTIQFYKMSNNLTPQYLSNLIPQNFGMIHDHNTRYLRIQVWYPQSRF